MPARVLTGRYPGQAKLARKELIEIAERERLQREQRKYIEDNFDGEEEFESEYEDNEFQPRRPTSNK